MWRGCGEALVDQPDERHASTGLPREALEAAQTKVSDLGVVPSGRSRTGVVRALLFDVR